MPQTRSRRGSQMVAGASKARSAEDHRNHATTSDFRPLVGRTNKFRKLIFEAIFVRPLPGSIRHSTPNSSDLRCCAASIHWLPSVIPGGDQNLFSRFYSVMTLQVQHQSGTRTLALMCFKFATRVKLITTNNDHELHLLKCTLDQAPSWSG